MKLLIIIPLLLVIQAVQGSRVLMVLSLGSQSHKNIFTPLAEKLSQKGHDVTIVSMHSSSAATGNSTNLSYRDIVAKTAWKFVQSATGEFDVFKMKKTNKDVNSQVMKRVVKNLPDYCAAFLTDPAVSSVWNWKPDLILLPAFMNECGLAFVHKHKVPFIYVTTSGLTPWTSDIMGNPEHPAFVPNQYLPYSDEMTLWQRVVNTIMRIASPIARKHFVLNRLEPVVKEFLDDKTLSLEMIDRNASLVLVNSHHSLGFPRPMLPNVIEVGGMHCRKATPLYKVDKKLDHFLKSSEPSGAILFSLGSSIKSSQLPEDILQMFKNVFARLPYKIIWKWEGSRPENLSDNVLTRDWLPQQDILGHPSVRAFFTHAGLLSIQESAYHGVPVIALPLMSDQNLNARHAETLGMGIALNLQTLSESAIESSIRRVLEKKTYRDNAIHRSAVMKDQETHPLDRAAYWSEYVLRHRGAEHLRSSSTNLTFSQYYLFDVAGILLLVTVAIFVASYLIVKYTYLTTSTIIKFAVARFVQCFHFHKKSLKS